jgi:hypothetical protein
MRPATAAACIAHIRSQISSADHQLVCALIDQYSDAGSVADIDEAHRIRRAAILNLPIAAGEVREAEAFLWGGQWS